MIVLSPHLTPNTLTFVQSFPSPMIILSFHLLTTVLSIPLSQMFLFSLFMIVLSFPPNSPLFIIFPLLRLYFLFAHSQLFFLFLYHGYFIFSFLMIVLSFPHLNDCSFFLNSHDYAFFLTDHLCSFFSSKMVVCSFLFS